MTAYDEERLGSLLSSLPPVPEALVQAAKDVPTVRVSLAAIVERAEVDEDYRRKVVADPVAALEEADVVAHADAVEILKRKLDK
jgi:hypothetical protein